MCSHFFPFWQHRSTYDGVAHGTAASLVMDAAALPLLRPPSVSNGEFIFLCIFLCFFIRGPHLGLNLDRPTTRQRASYTDRSRCDRAAVARATHVPHTPASASLDPVFDGGCFAVASQAAIEMSDEEEDAGGFGDAEEEEEEEGGFGEASDEEEEEEGDG